MDCRDIENTQIGELHVDCCIGYITRPDGKRKDLWYECTCSCGRKCIFRRDHLREKRVRSCGDCHKVVSEGDYFRYVCHNGESFIFGEEDYDEIVPHRWHIFNRSGHEYVARRDGKNYILLSHVLLKPTPAQYVDHINGDTLDYRRSNLRMADSEKNTWNNALRKDNLSGYKGVHYSKVNGKYYVSINYHKEKIRLGCYDNPIDAARAYDEAARFYFGEFACVNFPQPGEQGCMRNQAVSDKKAV